MSEHVCIIAEAGVNHNGSLELAKKLVDVAAEAGVDYVKFQTFRADKLVSPDAKKAAYQKANMQSSEGDDGQYSMLKKLELDEAAHDVLMAYCEEKGVRFLSTPFDEESIALLKEKGITIGKIPSGEITNLPFLRAMAKTFPELIVSTGMCSMEEVEAAITALLEAGADKNHITLLHCNTEYPTPMSDVNLRTMMPMAAQLGLKPGYSDHTEGIEVPVAAVALGATVIEKHFTLDKTMDGPDHKASLEPHELIAMVAAIRNIEQALGRSNKVPTASEVKNKAVARKSIVAKTRILQGELFTEDNLVVKRPGTGISPMQWDTVVGTRAVQNFEPDQLIVL